MVLKNQTCSVLGNAPKGTTIVSGPVSVSSLRLVRGTANLLSCGKPVSPKPPPFLSRAGTLLGKASFSVVLTSRKTRVCHNAVKIWGGKTWAGRGRGAG